MPMMPLPPLKVLLSITLVAGLTLAGEAKAQTDAPAALFARMAGHVAAQQHALIAFRHDVHRHPELSGAEVRTAGLIAARLTDLGFEVRTGVGGHGVVGVLEGSRPGPVVAFRADMDAVRSSAPDPFEIRSVIPGVRHICGHDVHMAVGIGLAEAFSAHRAALAGTVMLLFQPAEERGTGAKAMLADGVFETLKPDAVFALHTAPYNVGEVATVAGGMMAGRASVVVNLRGSEDLVEATARVREALRGAGTLSPQLSGRTAPKGFILVQLFPQGTEAVVRGQVMTAGHEDRDRAKAAVRAALAPLEGPDLTLETVYDERFMEGVNNDTALVELANAGIGTLAPEITMRTVGGAVPAFSEDFGSFQALVPGVMYFLGVNNPEAGTVGMPHSPAYVADDASILAGTRAMLAAMLTRLTAG